jgi:hypothetical protein
MATENERQATKNTRLRIKGRNMDKPDQNIRNVRATVKGLLFMYLEFQK